MKLLLVDDDADQLQLRALALAQAASDIRTASDAASALRLATAEPPDVAIVDLRLPTQEAGLKLIRDLKSLSAAIRIILLTGSDPAKLAALPERKLIEAVFQKGNAARQLIAHLKDGAAKDLRAKLAADGKLTLDVKVIPRSSKSEIVGFTDDGSLKVKLAAVPEKGKANEELIALLAAYFGVRKDAVELLIGETSQRKRLRILATYR